MGIGKFSVEAVFSATDRMTSTLAKMDKSVMGFAARNEKRLATLNQVNNSIAKSFAKVGAVAAGVGGLAAAATMDIVKVGSEFDATLSGAAAKLGAKRGTEAFERLKRSALEVGETTEYSAQQAAEGLETLAGAGMNDVQAMAALPVIIDAATAANVEFAKATELSTGALGAFGLKSIDAETNAKNLSRVTNVLAQGANTTAASMEDLGASIEKGGPVAAAAGQKLETFVAMAGSMADANLKGELAGTMLKNVFTSLAAPSSKKAVEMLKKLGVTTKDSKGDMRDALDILRDLGKATKGMGTGTRLGALETIFGKEALPGVTKMLDDGADKIAEIRRSLEKAVEDQAAAKLAAMMRDNVKGDLDALSSTIDGVKLAIFDLNQGPIRDVIQGMTGWVKANQGLIVQKIGDTVKWISDNMESIVKWTERLAIAAGAFFTLKTGVSILSTTIKGYQTIAGLAKSAFGKGGGCDVASLAAGAADKCCCGSPAGKAADAAGGGTSLLTKGRSLLAKGAGMVPMVGGLLNTSIGGITAMGAGATAAAAAGVVGAGALGYAFGSWLNDQFQISDKIVDSILGPSPERATERGLGGSSPQVITPEERIATSIEKTQAEITIKDQTGNASVTKQPKGKSVNLSLTPSGAF